MRSVSVVLILAAALLLTAVLPVSADELAEKGRAVFDKNKAAVVTVQAVVSISFGQEEQEQEIWANGTVVDPTGVAVLSLMLVDPLAALADYEELPGEATSKIVSLKMVLADGSEVASEVVLRDKDLDLAFVRPVQKPEKPMACADLANAGKPQLLDNVAIITQLGEVARRAHSVLLERIETIVEKPRTYYVIGQHRANDVLSSPVFTLDGKFIGMGAVRSVKGGQGHRQQSRNDRLVTVVAAEDIKEAVTHVPPFGAKIEESTTTIKPKKAAEEPAADQKQEGGADQVTLPAKP